MKTNPSKMNMETADLSPTEWLEKFIEISKKELELSKKSSDDRVVYIINDDDGAEGDDDDDNYIYGDDNYVNGNIKYIYDDENRKKLEAQYDLRMIPMGPLFASQPRLEKICKDWDNEFLPSCFTSYTFNSNENDSVNEFHEKANDLEYLINLCGFNLTYLDVKQYPISQIMPIINANCPNLEFLYSRFKEIMSQDFENVFSNMSHLKHLTIEWQCENSTLPMTLATSLEQIGGTLESLELSCCFARNYIFLPDSLASVFPRLIALNSLIIRTFGLSQLSLQSIGGIKNLADLQLYSYQPENHPMFDTRINMYPIGNLKNLEKLYISCDYGVRDEFLINLCNNAKNLRNLQITGPSITDTGMSAIDNLQELEVFYLRSTDRERGSKKNEFITDESIQCLFNQKLHILDISSCINITDKGVIKLAENLPNLRDLHIVNAKVSEKTVKKVEKLTEHRKEPLIIQERIENVD